MDKESLNIILERMKLEVFTEMANNLIESDYKVIPISWLVADISRHYPPKPYWFEITQYDTSDEIIKEKVKVKNNNTQKIEEIMKEVTYRYDSNKSIEKKAYKYLWRAIKIMIDNNFLIQTGNVNNTVYRVELNLNNKLVTETLDIYKKELDRDKKETEEAMEEMRREDELREQQYLKKINGYG